MSSQELLNVASAFKKLSFDYTPKWGRGNPSSYVDNVTFPKVLTNKDYQYRLKINGQDKGISPSYAVQADGSQKVNFLEYNSGYGIIESSTIQVFIVDPDDKTEAIIAQWN